MRLVADRLRLAGIRPSAHRVVVAEYVLSTEDHPTAAQVYKVARARLPMISKATVYNTLSRMVERGLIQSLVLAEGHLVYDGKTTRHHHFIDDETGRVYDVPWSTLAVAGVPPGAEFEVSDYQVVMRGRRLPRSRPRSRPEPRPRSGRRAEGSAE
jgi:Fe2+ or Zn2+ uptake regulation protein